MNPARASRPGRLVLTLVACLAAVVAGLTAGTASAASPTPVRIVIDAITSSVAAPAGTPGDAVPYVLVEAGQPFDVHVSFYDAAGLPASFNNDTTLAITSNRGTLTPSTGVALKGQTSATLTTSLSTAANQVLLTVKVASGPRARDVAPDTSDAGQAFDVLSDLRFENSSANFQQGIGGEGNCTNATRQAPVCGVVMLPFGATSSQVLLSLGVCDTAYAGCGSTKGSVVQTLADLSGLYSRDNPAAVVMKCDKSLCGGGPIQDSTLSFSLAGNAPLATAPPCPAKATIGAGQDACVDYVQSKRDGSGDTHLYLLIYRDARISVG